MANMNTIIDDFASAIATDQSIDTWSKSEYDQGATVLENCDPRNDPESDDCPLVIIFPAQKAGGLSQGVKTHVFGISCVVFDSGKPESIQDVVRFKGGRNVETLRGLVVDVIQANIQSDLHLEAVVTDYNTIEQFPFVSANMEITLTQEKLIGSDPIE
jgi:hypothetical protein